MKVETKSLKNAVELILQELNTTPDELEKITGVSRVTIFNILNLKNPTTQRGVARKLAEKTGHALTVSPKGICTFTKLTENSNELNQDEFELIKLYRGHSPEIKQAVKHLLGLRGDN